MKRIILFCFLLGLISPIAIEAKKKPFGNGLFWELNDNGTLIISGIGSMQNYGYTKSRYFHEKQHEKRPWYKMKNSIKDVVIEEGVSTIGGYVFYDCKNLSSITIPNSVTSIGSSAFEYCSGLTSVTIPNSVTSIGGGAFYYCSGLTSVTIPNSVTSIGGSAFYNCSGLTSITIPNSVTRIESQTFYGCSGLTSVTIPGSVTSIGSSAFSDCSGLTSVMIPGSVTSIGSYAFKGCNKLSSVVIPEGVTRIGEGVFRNCSSLVSLIIPNSVTEIDQHTGYYEDPIILGCRNLQRLSIPRNLKSAHSQTFAIETELNRNENRYHVTKPYEGQIISMPDNMKYSPDFYGLSETSVNSYKYGLRDSEDKLILPGKKGWKYSKVIDKVFVGVDYYIVEEDGKVGLVDNTQKWIIPLTDSYRKIDGVGGGYFSLQDKNYTYSIIDTWGNTIIPASKGYSYIGNYNSTTKTFKVSKGRYDGTCDKNGRELSMTKRPPTKYDIKYDGGYSDVTEITNDGIKYFLVTKNGYKGLTDSQGKVIIQADLELLEQAGAGFLRFKLADFYGIMNYQGKTLIPTSRGYTKIGNYVASQKVFSYEANGYKGECNNLGVQVSKIKTGSDTDSSSSGGKTSNTTTTTSDKNKTDTKEQKIIIEHHRDPVPVQQWQACWACGGMGTMGCDNCGGSGTKYIGDRLHICSRCNGQRLIPCNICHGNKGQYTTVYQ